MPWPLAVFLFFSLRWSIHSYSSWVTNWVHFPGFQGMPVDHVRKGHRASRMSTRQSPNPVSHHACVGCVHLTSLQQSESWKSNGGKWKLQMGFFSAGVPLWIKDQGIIQSYGGLYMFHVTVFVSMHVRACGCVDSLRHFY